MVNACNSAEAAKRILAAVEAGSLVRLEAELEGSRCAPSDLPPESAERWELLDALTTDLRLALRRKRQHTLTALETVDVHVRLLRHLAGQALLT